MSVTQKIPGTVEKFAPDQTTGAPPSRDSVGRPVSRVDGPLKVKGEATFTAEFQVEKVAFAALVYSSVAKGTMTRINRGEAERAPGVLLVMTHHNAPRMKPPGLYAVPDGRGSSGGAGSPLPVMQSADVSWNGEPVAVVVAESQVQANYAASLIGVEYQAEAAATAFDALKADAKAPETILGEPPEIRLGDADAALEAAAVKVDQVYRTPRENASAIELHATLAVWDKDGGLLVYDPTQSITWFKDTLCGVFGLAPEKVRVVAPFVGGGFGGKAMMWNHTLLCAAAAKLAARPVKLVLPRKGVFYEVGARAMSEQRVALGAQADGKLTALIHSGTTGVAHDAFPEQFSFSARHLYASENLLVSQKTAHLNVVSTSPVRAPGDSIGTFALESAMDELAYALGLDPIEFRRINEPEHDPTSGKPFSSRHLLEAYQRGAERFGWTKRSRNPRSQRDGEWLIGQGVASCYYPYIRFPGAARVRLAADGSATVQAAAHEMGMGTATVQIQHAAQRLGLPLEQVSFEYGDSNLPHPFLAGGSSQTASLVATVSAATEKLQRELLELVGNASPLAGAAYEQVEARGGGLFLKGAPDQGETYAAILQRAGRDRLEVDATSAAPSEMMDYSMHSYGAQFCEVRVHETTGEVRVSRWVGSFDVGKVLNAKTAQSQFRGAIVMGIGMALTEEMLFDERTGRIMNPSLAEYHVPVHLDVPPIDILYTDIPDPQAPLGLHGVGEIGITGAAAAIANAVFHATGVRIRDLPITLDKVLTGVSG